MKLRNRSPQRHRMAQSRSDGLNSRPWMVLGGLGIAGVSAYVLDPRRGRRRRHQLGDQVVRTAHVVTDSAGVVSRDLANRGTGLVAETTAALKKDSINEQVLAARVRSKLGRIASHPHSISVLADDGKVTLSGPALADEVDQILKGVASVKGVNAVQNEMTVSERPGDIPGLQGAPRRPRGLLQQEYWPPAIRLIAGLAGAGLAWRGSRGGILTMPIAIVGSVLMLRSITNLPLKRIFGVGAGRRAVVVRKSMTLLPSPNEVFAFWSNLENFPRFMANVLEVRPLQDGRHHWKVAGPLGVPISFNTVITRYIENREIAWKTTPGSPIQHAGRVVFQEELPDSTRLDIHMSYNPLAGLVGHAVASFFGTNPKQTMDEDLVRLKSLLEAGKTTARGEEISIDQVS